MLIRRAVEGDWVQIWPFLCRVVAAGDTYCWPSDTTEAGARTWWTGKPGGRVYVAELPGSPGVPARVVGTAELHPNQPAAGSHVANAGFMVDPDAAGQGVGRALAEFVIGEARELGYRAMQFNAVVETNLPALRLWRSLGFDVVATLPGAFQHPAQGPVGLHVLWRDLGAAGSPT